MTNNKFHRSYVEGSYVSTDGMYRAELRQAGYSEEYGCKMDRHYVIFSTGYSNVLGDARTLKEAERRFLHA